MSFSRSLHVGTFSPLTFVTMIMYVCFPHTALAVALTQARLKSILYFQLGLYNWEEDDR